MRNLDGYQEAMLEWIRKAVIHSQTAHGRVVNTITLPITIWENLGRPMRLDGMRVIPFDNPCDDPKICVGITPDELKF